MNRTVSSRPSPSRQSGRASTVALIVFGLVYVGALAITFAPKGSLSDSNSVAATTLSE